MWYNIERVHYGRSSAKGIHIVGKNVLEGRRSRNGHNKGIRAGTVKD